MVITNGKYCVYAHINKTNGKIYIGQTCKKPRERWSKGIGYKSQPHFWASIQKYGWDGFEHEIIASNLTKEEADNFERLLIEKLNTTNPYFGYNMTLGGEGCAGCFPSEETRNKISERAKKRFENQEARDIQRENARRQWENPEIRNKMIESLKGENHPLYGKHPSDETRRKMSAVRQGKDNARARAVYQIDKYSGEIIKEWPYIMAACNELGITISNIISCCRGRHKTAGGFKWAYADSEEEDEI